MALRHINLTRRAATAIAAGGKYYIAKKQYFEQLYLEDPDKANKSKFFKNI